MARQRTSRPPRAALVVVFAAMRLPALGWADAAAPGPQGTEALTLDRSLQLALHSHPDLTAAAAELQEAKAAVEEARLRRSHFMSLSAGPQWSRGLGGGNPNAGFASLAMQADCDLDLARKRKLAESVAAASLKAVSADFEGARRAVAQAVIDAYFDVLRQQRAVAVAQQGLTQDKDQLERAQALFKEDLVPRLDTVKAETQVSWSEQEVITAQGQLMAALATLRSLLSLPEDLQITVAEVDEKLELEGAVESLQTQALTSSPELRSLDARIAEAVVEIQRARTLRRPDLSVQASHLLTSDPADYGNRMNLGLVASIGLDDWRAKPAVVEQARARLKASQAHRLEAERQLKLQILRQWTDFKSRQKLVDTAKAGLSVAEENVRLTRIGYDSQVNTMKEVLDAQTDLTRARAAYWNAVYDAATSVAYLQTLTGVALDKLPAEDKRGDGR